MHTIKTKRLTRAQTQSVAFAIEKIMRDRGITDRTSQANELGISTPMWHHYRKGEFCAPVRLREYLKILKTHSDDLPMDSPIDE